MAAREAKNPFGALGAGASDYAIEWEEVTPADEDADADRDALGLTVADRAALGLTPVVPATPVPGAEDARATLRRAFNL